MSDNPPIRCLSCGMQFWTQWINIGGGNGVEYCPFCGDDDLTLDVPDV